MTSSDFLGVYTYRAALKSRKPYTIWLILHAYFYRAALKSCQTCTICHILHILRWIYPRGFCIMCTIWQISTKIRAPRVKSVFRAEFVRKIHSNADIVVKWTKKNVHNWKTWCNFQKYEYKYMLCVRKRVSYPLNRLCWLFGTSFGTSCPRRRCCIYEYNFC